jgi:6-pyruvoyltetrahydropterin/6-carboxytetrahydropterin synthase
MSIIRLTREFSFEMSHTLDGYDGACSQLHGHSYRLFVTVAGRPSERADDPKLGMVMDFGVLKKIVGELVVDRLDHALLLRETAADADFAAMMRRRFTRVITVPFQPTCENLIAWFAALLIPALPAGVALHSLRLHETARSYAEWHASDNAGV